MEDEADRYERGAESSLHRDGLGLEQPGQASRKHGPLQGLISPDRWSVPLTRSLGPNCCWTRYFSRIRQRKGSWETRHLSGSLSGWASRHTSTSGELCC